MRLCEVVDLLVDDRSELFVLDAVDIPHGDLQVVPRLFSGQATRMGGSQPQCNSPRDAMQPAAERILISHRFCSLREDEERGLKGIFGDVRSR